MRSDAAPAAAVPASDAAPGWIDRPVAGLDQALLAAIDAAKLPFLNSLGFCTIYEHPPATRARLRMDGQGRVLSAGFYRERSLPGLVRVLEFAGYDGLDDVAVREAIADRRASLATIHRILPPVEAGRDHHPADARTSLLTYDVIADLPATADEYLTALGKQKRQQLPRYWRRLQREHPDRVAMMFREGAEISLDDILALVGFNQSRMKTRGRGDHTAEEAARQRRRLPLTRKEGLLGLMTIDGRPVGGTFNYLRGDEAFLIIPAHDPAFEHLNVGNVCLWLTINHLISRGVRRYHLFWGRKAYKTQFLGKDHPVVMQVVGGNGLTASLWKWRMGAARFLTRAVKAARRKIGV